MSEPVPDVEFRAVDMTVLDIKPGDKILLRHPQRLDMAMIDDLVAACKANFPGPHEVIVLDGGLELSVLRPTTEPDLVEYRIEGYTTQPIAIEHDTNGCDWADLAAFDNPTVEHILDKIRRHHAAAHQEG